MSDTFPIAIAIGLAIAVFAALTTLLSTFFTVEQRTAAIVQRLGKFVRGQAIVAGLRDSGDEFRRSVQGTTAKDVMNLVLMTQYFEFRHAQGNRGLVAVECDPDSSFAWQPCQLE